MLVSGSFYIRFMKYFLNNRSIQKRYFVAEDDEVYKWVLHNCDVIKAVHEKPVNVKEIIDKTVKKVQELSEDFKAEVERRGEENEFYKFITPVTIAYSEGICNYFKTASKDLGILEVDYVSKMAEKRDIVRENDQNVDMSSLLDFSDLIHTGMSGASQKLTSERKKIISNVETTKIVEEYTTDNERQASNLVELQWNLFKCKKVIPRYNQFQKNMILLLRG